MQDAGFPYLPCVVTIHLRDIDEQLGCRYERAADDNALHLTNITKNGPLGRAEVPEDSYLTSVDGFDVNGDLNMAIKQYCIQENTTVIPLELEVPELLQLVKVTLTRTDEPLGLHYTQRYDGLLHIDRLTPGGAFERAGFKPEMVLRRVNGEDVFSGEDVKFAVERIRGSRVTHFVADIAVFPGGVVFDTDVRKQSISGPETPEGLPFREVSDRFPPATSVTGGTAPNYPPPPFPSGGGVGGPMPSSLRAPSSLRQPAPTTTVGVGRKKPFSQTRKSIITPRQATPSHQVRRSFPDHYFGSPREVRPSFTEIPAYPLPTGIVASSDVVPRQHHRRRTSAERALASLRPGEIKSITTSVRV
eukprot:TRINITY_DN19171_c0_g1_i1.p1 TRINITY_DN19171_c0_g1~~TRINITY_DN19171_c0_g1_i1.p1  ORF type:complete len:385 (+),score=29.45 TRINITY_DN19171_c0_g1_i1:76-1155(+)